MSSPFPRKPWSVDPTVVTSFMSHPWWALIRLTPSQFRTLGLSAICVELGEPAPADPYLPHAYTPSRSQVTQVCLRGLQGGRKKLRAVRGRVPDGGWEDCSDCSNCNR